MLLKNLGPDTEAIGQRNILQSYFKAYDINISPL